ncbi:UNVERIFIED_CONTAM: hypothetical protein DES50_11614 [Williamsia faeni]
MASQEPPAVRTEEADSEVRTSATPGAETLGSPDAQSDVADGTASTDDAVLAPATPGAETLGVEEETDD